MENNIIWFMLLLLVFKWFYLRKTQITLPTGIIYCSKYDFSCYFKCFNIYDTLNFHFIEPNPPDQRALPSHAEEVTRPRLCGRE